MTPETYIARVAVALEANDWPNAEYLCDEVCQVFANTRDWHGLRKFFLSVLEVGASPDVKRKVLLQMEDTRLLSTEMRTSFGMAVQRANGNPLIRAIYFEYDISSGEYSSTGDFFCVSAIPMIL